MREKVAAAIADTYEPEEIRSALEEIIGAVDGFAGIGPGTKVALKINMVHAGSPEKAITTHPVIVRELAGLLRERGALVRIGDSPGGLFTPEILKGIYRSCGYGICEEAGAELNLDTSVRPVSFPGAAVLRSFSYTGWLDWADCVIDVCKLKSHGMLKMTAAVKNLFGTIPGVMKPEYHMRFSNESDFTDMLIDLNEYFRPVLTICDAIDCMEGNGPTQGTKRHMGVLLASRSTYSTDVVCEALLGMKPGEVPTVRRAAKRGLGPASPEEVEIVGDEEALWARKIPDFDIPAATKGIDFGREGSLGGRLIPFVMKTVLAARPQVKDDGCIGCGKCADICPAHAITMEKDRPQIDRKQCIHCFCCQEFCPAGAMRVHRTFIARLLTGGHRHG